MEFSKYHGNGNDFIILDNRLNQVNLSSAQIAAMCDRHFGIGADGLMLLENREGFDFSLRYFNSDGYESTMCGNGGRCITAFANSLGIINKKAGFIAIDGPHESEIFEHPGIGYMVRLKMKDTQLREEFADGYLIDTGSPHFVRFVPDVDSIDIMGEGRALRYDKRFTPGGCNVNFVEIKPEVLWVRTYERGVENETLSCGTGVTAAALVTALTHSDNKGFFRIRTKGGEFKVFFHLSGDEFIEVYLEGPAAFVFKGEITV
ncbi:MAG: diaminopimelate epimerase [Bacteroidetes bacterium]|nr:diaminopimelate epimerase [Bacteroidota bacterium]